MDVMLDIIGLITGLVIAVIAVLQYLAGRRRQATQNDLEKRFQEVQRQSRRTAVTMGVAIGLMALFSLLALLV